MSAENYENYPDAMSIDMARHTASKSAWRVLLTALLLGAVPYAAVQCSLRIGIPLLGAFAIGMAFVAAIYVMQTKRLRRGAAAGGSVS